MSMNLSQKANIDELITNTRWLAKRQRLSLVDCAFFGTDLDKVIIVPTAVHPKTDSSPPRAIDLEFGTYVSTYYDAIPLSYDLDDCVTQVERWPLVSLSPSPFSYTLFTTNHPLVGRNKLVSALYGAQDIKIRGAILVAKSDRTGAVCPIATSEISFIQAMVVDILKRGLVPPHAYLD